MNKKKHQAITLLSVLTVMIAFFIAPIMSLAATVNYTKVANYVSTWHIKSMGGLHWTDDGVYMIKANNEPAFCIEHGVMLKFFVGGFIGVVTMCRVQLASETDRRME